MYDKKKGFATAPYKNCIIERGYAISGTFNNNQ
jgi:hypothetical protein